MPKRLPKERTPPWRRVDAVFLAAVLLVMLLIVCRFARPGATRRSEGEDPAPPSNTVTLLAWNVENLFDAEDDPGNQGDDEFTPGAWRHWNAERYGRKVRNLAAVLARAGADVVGLAEIENRRVLEDLARAVQQAGGPDYTHIVHREGTDGRGVDVAALSVFEPVAVHWYTPLEGQRDILRLDLAPGGAPLVVFVNHWKSRWGGVEKTHPLRLQIAQRLRREVDRIAAENGASAIVVLGDFNEDAGGPAQVRGLGVLTKVPADTGEPARALVNLHLMLPMRDRGTFYYRRESVWNSFDNIMVSRAMLPGGRAPWTVVAGSYGVWHEPALFDTEGHPRPFRIMRDRQSREWTYVEGFSDHLPVRVRLQRRRE